MSTNTDSENGNNSTGAVPSYRKGDNAASVDQKRKTLERREQAEQAERSAKTKSARKALAEEKSPKELLQEATRKTIDKEFRGITFTFEEFGQDALEVQKAGAGGDVEDGTEAAFMLYDKLGTHCIGVDFEGLSGEDIDSEFWAGYDLGDDEGDGVVNLFVRIIQDSSDVDAAEANSVKN